MDTTGECVEAFITDDGFGAVDLKNEATRAGTLGLVDEPLEVIGDNVVEQTRHLEDVKNTRIEGVLGWHDRGRLRPHGVRHRQQPDQD